MLTFEFAKCFCIPVVLANGPEVQLRSLFVLQKLRLLKVNGPARVRQASAQRKSNQTSRSYLRTGTRAVSVQSSQGCILEEAHAQALRSLRGLVRRVETRQRMEGRKPVSSSG